LSGAVKWHCLDGKVDRRSYEGLYKIDPIYKLPVNPMGRTGISGRGLLGRFGPNHAADPIVTRWKRKDNGEIATDSQGLRLLEFVAVQRKDNGQWALPGGMVEPGDTVSLTLKKEFGVEACSSLKCTESERQELRQKLDKLFQSGTVVYKGYVDDPRNTDNAWMETVAVNIHDSTGSCFDKFDLKAGDDAAVSKSKTLILLMIQIKKISHP
jgi:ADP-ribose pyrophosphatase